jgi:hypothetical protein
MSFRLSNLAMTRLSFTAHQKRSSATRVKGSEFVCEHERLCLHENLSAAPVLWSYGFVHVTELSMAYRTNPTTKSGNPYRTRHEAF